MDELVFKVFNRRRNSEVTYRLRATESGWHISNNAINGDCEPDGTPFIYMNLRQDSISYPVSLESHLAWLWEQIDTGVIDYRNAKNKVQELANWVSICEKNTPIWEGWNG